MQFSIFYSNELKNTLYMDSDAINNDNNITNKNILEIPCTLCDWILSSSFLEVVASVYQIHNYYEKTGQTFAFWI